jgi:hypothetical protein
VTKTETTQGRYKCPKCGKVSVHYDTKGLNCGDCLMDHTEIVALERIGPTTKDINKALDILGADLKKMGGTQIKIVHVKED